MRFDTRHPAIRTLREADSALARVIDHVGPLTLEPADDRFVALAEAIVSQQLSLKAASTIWGRLEGLGPVRPDTVASLDETAMRAAGLSGAKVRYIKDLAATVLEGRVDLDGMDALGDEAVIEEVTLIKGIGRWTAEMFLIFSLARLDVLALDDAGLLRSAGWLLGKDGPATREEFAEVGARWVPYRSVASLYLWAARDRGMY